MSEAWRGCFCVMLSVKGASKKLQKGKTFIYRSGLVFTVEGAFAGNLTNFKTVRGCLSKTGYYRFDCCMCGFALERFDLL